MANFPNLSRSGARCRGAALLVLAFAAFTSSPRSEETKAEVNIDNFTFTPKELKVKAGTKITFRNRDDIPHSVVDANGAFHSEALDTGDGFSFTFTKPGSYSYFCSLHPQMQGRIVVAP